MEGYRVFINDLYGYDCEVEYVKSYNKAIQVFNNKVRKELRNIGEDIVDKEYFGEEIAYFKKSNTDREIISRKYPVLICKEKDGSLSATVFLWERTDYEYEEYDIINSVIRLEEIKIME